MGKKCCFLEEKTHKKLNILKSELGKKTLSQTIDELMTKKNKKTTW